MTAKSTIEQLLDSGLDDERIAERAGCARSYVRAVRSRLAAPTKAIFERRTHNHSPEWNQRNNAYMEAHRGKLRAGASRDEARKAGRAAYKKVREEQEIAARRPPPIAVRKFIEGLTSDA